MAKFVIDAGVGLKWFLDEGHSEKARSYLRSNVEYYIPRLFYLETSAVLTKKMRRRELDKKEATHIRHTLGAFPFDVTPDEYLEDQAFDLAMLQHVSMYEAMYIVLAITIEGRMITSDKRFARSMEQVGLADWIEVVGEY